MMGTKERAFGPLPPVSLGGPGPAGPLLPPPGTHARSRLRPRSGPRHLRRASAGPRIDPVVFFKLQLILFFEGLRSERQLMRVVADRLSLRWYLGYDLTEPLPDHSSLTRIRERYGLEVFRRFFEAIVEQCIAAGLVWGKELYIDSTKVAANAVARLAPAALRRRGAPRPALRRSGRRRRRWMTGAAIRTRTAATRRRPCRSR